ncbi:S-type pyocin domain-containing protein [Streptomyces hesseae]|uniref:S-type pyocin domain-containing protein n=1 Tax=Streptomyces hesseae TaxID=3075519 RepID=A0ABU2SPD8_9ACTN|nr:S-type pyocin domain-containing protein [Streptomyces sp. DSM 40473]MDT0449915.1 S-type pyocin domain-containing protein [Streptomyces sp. DSM 40473]
MIAFRRPQPTPEAVGSRHEAQNAIDEPMVPPGTVLNADRGIINTGTVHGGQHVTTIELSGRSEGADDDI